LATTRRGCHLGHLPRLRTTLLGVGLAQGKHGRQTEDPRRTPAWGGAKVVRHGRYVIFQMAVVAQAVLSMMRSLAPDRERATLAVVAAALVLAIPSAWGQIGAILLGGLAGVTVLRRRLRSCCSPTELQHWAMRSAPAGYTGSRSRRQGKASPGRKRAQITRAR
jgi:hypothetical protein